MLTRQRSQACYINTGTSISLLQQPQASITMFSLGRGIFTLLTTCNNKVLPTAVWSCSEARTTAAVFRKKHLKDIRRLGSDFKWKLNQGVKRLRPCSSSHYSLLLGVWFYLKVTGSKRQSNYEDCLCKHNLWERLFAMPNFKIVNLTWNVINSLSLRINWSGLEKPNFS